MPHGHHHHHGYKFPPEHLAKLRDPERLRYLNPDEIWAVLAARPIHTLVDLGAGLGFFAIPFAAKMPGGTVYACDANAEMIGHLRAELETRWAPNVKPVLTEEVRIPLGNSIADAVLMSNLHHELDDPEGTLSECKRVLKPGGIVAVIDWKPVQTPMGPPMDIRVSPDTVREQLLSAGFHAVTRHDLLPYHYFLTALI